MRATTTRPGPRTPATARGSPGFVYPPVVVPESSYSIAAAGHGPTVLLLHGFPQDQTCWHRVAAALAQDRTVVLCDLKGIGASRPAERYVRAFTPDDRDLVRGLPRRFHLDVPLDAEHRAAGRTINSHSSRTEAPLTTSSATVHSRSGADGPPTFAVDHFPAMETGARPETPPFA